MKQLETEWWLIEVSTRSLKVIHKLSGGLAERMSLGSRRSTFVYQADADDESTIGNVVESIIREWKPSSENRPKPTAS